MKDVLQDAREAAPSYGPLPFWSWNDELDEEELRRQIRRMRDLGMHGFFMHARGGLKTPYLGDAWFRAVRACVDEAKKWDMEAWAYDENGWPSGFAGGKLLSDPKNCMTGLTYEETETYPDGTDVYAVYRMDGKRAVRLDGREKADRYLVIRRVVSNSYVDTMNREVTEKFLAMTHELYRQETGADFGVAMPGFFTDEPQYNRWQAPYSDLLPDIFRARYGYDLRDGLPALFREIEGDVEFRYDYYKLCGEMFMENFARPIHEWCEAHGCRLTGHGVEEFSLAGQVMCCGSVMPFYLYEDIPGIDYLGRPVHDDLGGRQLGSVCAQFGKKKALSEMFACCGWDVSPRELKRIAESQYVNGVNLMCQHLYPYTEHGQRKRDYPNHYSHHTPWQDELADLDRYFTNLGALLSRGDEDVRTLVIHPIHAAYADYREPEGWGSCRHVQPAFLSLLERLSSAGLGYHFGEESLMHEYGHVDGASIVIGRCRYDRVILPEIDTIDDTTADLLRTYLENGGRLALAGAAPTRINARKSDALAFLASNTTVDAILAEMPVRYTGIPDGARVRQMVRRVPGGRLVYVVNTSGVVCPDVTLAVSGYGRAARVEIAALTETAYPCEKTADGCRINFALDDSEAAVFLFREGTGKTLPAAPRDGRYLRLSGPYSLSQTPRNLLTLDKFEVSRNGGAFSEEQPIERVREELLLDRFAGNVTLRTHFTVEEIPETLAIAAERQAYASFTVNGHALALAPSATYEKDLVTADILPFVRPGENEICFTLPYSQSEETYFALYEASSEALKNCIAYDGEIECVYLFGRFALRTPGRFTEADHGATRYDGTFSLVRPEKTLALRDVTHEGYPFFSGVLTVETALSWHPGDPTVLHLPGRYAVARVSVNGHAAGKCFFSDKLDLAPYLTTGENAVTVTLISSNRNLLGPHHGAQEAEPYAVGPYTFEMQGMWHAGQCAAYRPDYAFVRFGLD